MAVVSLRGGDGAEVLLRAVAELYVRGIDVDWVALEGPFRGRVLSLPTYPFDRTGYWDERAVVPDAARWTAAVAAAREQADQGPLDLRPDTYPAKWDALNRLATSYMAAALRQLGLYGQAGDALTVAEVVGRAGIGEAHRAVVERWLEHLVAVGRLRAEGPRLVAPEALPDGVSPSLRSAAREAFSDGTAPVDLVEQCGPSLAAVVTGAASALDLLFPDGSTALTEALYETTPAARYVNAIVRAVVGAAAAGRPYTDVLEIGAGTGATTAAVLPRLDPARTVYTFTDVSPMFLDRGRLKFAAFGFLRYGLLDVSRLPAEQGMVPHGCDLVIASNVLHATRDLGRALAHVRQMLAAGGLLVLAETTVYRPWLDVTFGLTSGWNHFDDRWRTNRPLLDAAGWRQALLANGFEAVDVQPAEGAAGAVLGQCVVIARGPGTVEAVAGAPSPGPRLLTADRTAPGPAAGSPLETLRDLPAVERLERLVSLVGQTVAGVLRVDVSHAPGRSDRLMESGLDSLMAVELRNALARALQTTRRFPATLIFDYPTIEAIAGHIDQVCFAEAQPTGTPASTAAEGERPAQTTAAELEGLDDDDVEALLNKRLERI